MLSRLCAAIVFASAFGPAAVTAAENHDSDEAVESVGDLLRSGWEIAGYASNSDNRSTFILFKKPNTHYLVQCLTGYDVTRQPRVFENCYRLP